MAATPADPRPAETYAEVEDALLSRWPESRLDPTLDRIEAFTELLGDPQRAYPVIHLTGTNGKTSTARMIETLLRGLGLRTGRFTSPHLESMTERIVVDGEALSDEEFVRAFNDVAPYTHLVDAEHDHPLSFFETVVGMAYAAFADAPVDVAVVEVGMGGAWDATNVADGMVAVLTPIAIDHEKYLGDTVAKIAREKVGIIKPGATVVTAVQDAGRGCRRSCARAAEVGAIVAREGLEFGVAAGCRPSVARCCRCRACAVRTTRCSCRCTAPTRPRTPPRARRGRGLLGGDEPLADEVVKDAFAEVTSPGRLEIVRRRRRSCSTRRTTRTEPRRWSRRSRTRSPSARWSVWWG